MSDFVIDDIRESLKNASKREAARILQEKFADFDCKPLTKMTNKDFAIWQSKYSDDSPQYLYALHEWNRRAAKENRRLALWTVISGFAGIILEAGLNWLLT